MLGETLDDRYRLLEVVGVGTFGTVYRARDETLDAPVAIKILHLQLTSEPGAVERLRKEVVTTAGLQHPNIVAVFDYGTVQDAPYMCSEYVHGVACTELGRGVQDEWEAGAVLIMEAARGLDYAHRQGVVHRDVKPGNILIGCVRERPMAVKIADFGIADVSRVAGWLEHLRSGTRGYMCAEALRGEQPAPQMDVYALGVVAHEVLLGRSPVWQTDGRLVRPPKASAGWRRRVMDVVELALDDDPSLRWESCVAFREELGRAVGGEKACSRGMRGLERLVTAA